jgi:hypothetical protein
LGEARERIVGGYVDDETTGVVGLAVDFGGHPFIGFCSGTLIAPNLVLTAQHCVALLQGSPGGERVICGETTFRTVGQGSYFLVSPATVRPMTASDPRFFRGSEVRVAPGGETDVCGHDIALLILRDSIPGRLATPIIPRVDASPTANETFSADGYGLTEPDAAMGGGTRMRLDGNTVFCMGGVDCPLGGSVQDGEWASDARTCSGDSGGPALDEQGRVMGVLSRGPEGCGGAIYGDVASWSELIISTARDAASAGGYPPPFWTNGSSIPPPPPPDAGPPHPDAECSDSSECGRDLVCYAASSKPPGICVSRCGANDACQEGYSCKSSVGVCLRAAPSPGDDGGCSVKPSSGAYRTAPGAGFALAAGLLLAVRSLRGRKQRS